MKLAMMSYTLARQLGPGEKLDIRAMCELTRELDMDAVDLVTTHDNDPHTLRKILDDYGLQVAAYTFYADLNHDSTSARRKGVDQIKRGVETALVLGTTRTMIPTPGKEGFTREQSRANYIAGLSEGLEFANQAGVTLTVENFPGALSPFVTSDDVLQAVRALPGLMLTFDNGNVLTGGEDPAECFLRTRDYVVHAHFKDWTIVEEGAGMKGVDGRSYRPALIGEGIVDHASCIQAMADAGYEGYINIEYEGNDYPAAVAVRKAVNYLSHAGSIIRQGHRADAGCWALSGRCVETAGTRQALVGERKGALSVPLRECCRPGRRSPAAPQRLHISKVA